MERRTKHFEGSKVFQKKRAEAFERICIVNAGECIVFSLLKICYYNKIMHYSIPKTAKQPQLLTLWVILSGKNSVPHRQSRTPYCEI